MTPLLFFIFVVLFHVAKPSVVFSGFASTAWWLVFGGSVTAVAVQVTGLGRRLVDLYVRPLRHILSARRHGRGASGGRQIRPRRGFSTPCSRSKQSASTSHIPKVYQLALDRFALPAAAIRFQSSNGWDANSAAAFGMRVVWCNRYGQPPEWLPGKPDREITRSARPLSRTLNRRN